MRRCPLLQTRWPAACRMRRQDALQELLESPHLSLELAALMDQLPSHLDKVRKAA